ncbi:alpha-L-fucosidase [Aurantibacter crassamenti]|uniref:alpha-L-fucosidase n=1 Tax=Aurantibacter crassamenti TaxID=1837375 RepID=UPI00193A2970|nr:alpha-L-fucosidase [Aurantibacter crassamenti]MBM1105014.1 alpha-L-fucosidase [Aurantibacter crassamenti]
MRKPFLVVFVLFVTFLNAQNDKPKGMEEMWGEQNSLGNDAPTSRTALFDEGNYAMFIHWGLYSSIGNQWKDSTYYGISEWIMNPRRAGIPVEEYKAETKNFNPVNFDATAIAQLAKDAGMKYIVITSKHHDGFAMYDSKSNDFNIVNATPFARDPMKELAKACKNFGLGFGFYYSHNQDWTFPGGNGGPSVNEKGKEVGFDYYFKKKCLPQVKEIVTNYGDIAMVWFDTPGEMEKKYVEELVKVVRKYQPNAMISGRAGHGLGDYKSLGDMNIPVKNIGGLWETVDVTNDSWGYAWYDKNWKSPKRILKSVISTVARGGTYMLNVGPSPDGTIPFEAKKSLQISGDWIAKYPHVLYNAGASPWGHALSWGDVTIASDGKLNLCVYKWPLDGELWLPGLKNTIKTANLWVDGKKLKLETNKNGNWVNFILPTQRPEKLVSIIEIEIDGQPEVSFANTIDPVFATELPVAFAAAQECTIAEKKWMEKFGEWKHIEQAQDWTEKSSVSWEVVVMEPGYYQTELNYTGEGRLVWNITSDENVVVQNQQNSSGVYQYFEMGLLKFNKPGKHSITISLVDGNTKSASLKELRLTPQKSME